jgi:AcrR family transcriptional regulator
VSAPVTSPEPVGRRAERQREILDSAAKLFREKGYASTTIRDIGAAAQLNHASSHYYFGSKAAILYAIYAEALDGFLDRFEAIPDADPDTMLSDIIRAGVLEAARRPDHTAVFFQERRWLDTHLDPRQVVALDDRRTRFRHGTVHVVERGIAEGVFVPTPPELVVELIVGAATWVYQRGGTEDAGAAADRCVEMIMPGLRSGRSDR